MNASDSTAGVESAAGADAAAVPAQDAPPDVREPSAVFSWPAHLRFWIIAAAGLTLDLWSKDWAFRTLRQGGRIEVIPGLLDFQTMLNAGALFGIGHGKTTLFLVASFLALLLVGWMFVQSPARRWTLQVALGAILAGALGNMYDRAFVRLVDAPGGSPRRFVVTDRDAHWFYLKEFPVSADDEVRRIPVDSPFRPQMENEIGYVRDFIKIRKFGTHELWPWVFNVADMLLVGGVSILAFHLWRDRRPERRSRQSSLDAEGASA